MPVPLRSTATSAAFEWSVAVPVLGPVAVGSNRTRRAQVSFACSTLAGVQSAP